MEKKKRARIIRVASVTVLVPVLVLVGALISTGLGEQTALASKVSSYAEYYVQVQPYSSVGAHACVWLWDGNGNYKGYRWTDNRMGTTHQVYFGSVFIDKPQTIKVKFADGTVRSYRAEAYRPWLNKRVVKVYYNGNCKG